MGKLMKMQPALVHVPIDKDIVETPRWLARDIVNHFNPTGPALDPCRGSGAFYDHLPVGGRYWCEIEEGRDFYACTKRFNWIIGNPPYSNLLSWIRHSFKLASNVAYLIPVHRAMASRAFYGDVMVYGGLKEVYTIGTGTDAGFPFGHWLAVLHWQERYRGPTFWSNR